MDGGVRGPAGAAGEGIGELTRAEVAEAVRRLGPWFHDLDLRGVRTAPDHPLGDFLGELWRLVEPAFPARMDGLSVLDVGCNAGFYSLELSKRGARVLGIDTDESYLAQARYAAGVLGADIEYRRLDVYDVPELGPARFDYVLFMGVFYHLRHPLLALERVAELVGRRLVFQSMVRGAAGTLRAAPDYPITERDVFADPRFPAMYFVENRYAGDPTNWWIPNDSALAAMLRSVGLTIEANPAPGIYFCGRT